MTAARSWDGRGMSPQTPSPEPVDYTGATLVVGQPVTFVESDPDRGGRPRLYSGQIKLIGDEQLVIESAGKLFMVDGREDRHLKAHYFATVFGLPDDPYEG